MDSITFPSKKKIKKIKDKEGGYIVPKEELINIFEATEGEINMIYGKIGNGKTYCATAMVLELLKEGKAVYVNWHIVVNDFDDRKSLKTLFVNMLFWRSIFYKIPRAKNLYYFDVDEGCYNYEGKMVAGFDGTASVVEYFSRLNDCEIFWDEGQDMFDSYEGTKFAKSKRRLILHTRHYHRTLNIISQRPTAIQVSARGNVNRFYKCVKLGTFLGLPRFARYEFQGMTGETVDESVEPDSTKVYWGSKEVFAAYNTNYLAEGIPKSQSILFEAFKLGFFERISKFLSVLFLKPKKEAQSILKVDEGTPF